MTAQVAELSATTWLRAIPFGAVAALIIAIPSDLIDNPIFGRPVEPKAIDYVILAITASLIGLILAIKPEPVDDTPPDGAAEDLERQDTRTLWGGFVSFLAVGCPVCNQAVVALLGTSGALSWWAPVQPFVGLAAIGLLLYTLKLRLATYTLVACPLPVPERS